MGSSYSGFYKPAKYYLRTFSRFEDTEGDPSLHLDWALNPFPWVTNGRFPTCEPALTSDPFSVDAFLELVLRNEDALAALVRWTEGDEVSQAYFWDQRLPDMDTLEKDNEDHVALWPPIEMDVSDAWVAVLLMSDLEPKE